MKRGFLCALAGALLLGVFAQHDARLIAQGGLATPLRYFKNYIITGDYVTGATALQGLGVDGRATGAIGIQGVPAGADLVAAYLYWQVATAPGAGSDSGSLGATFNTFPLSTEDGPFAKALGNGALSCGPSSGQGGQRVTYT